MVLCARLPLKTFPKMGSIGSCSTSTQQSAHQMLGKRLLASAPDVSAIAARTSSSESVGKSRRISFVVPPSATLATTVRKVTRVPLKPALRRRCVDRGRFVRDNPCLSFHAARRWSRLRRPHPTAGPGGRPSAAAATRCNSSGFRPWSPQNHKFRDHRPARADFASTGHTGHATRTMTSNLESSTLSPRPSTADLE